MDGNYVFPVLTSSRLAAFHLVTTLALHNPSQSPLDAPFRKVVTGGLVERLALGGKIVVHLHGDVVFRVARGVPGFPARTRGGFHYFGVDGSCWICAC